MSSKEVLKKLKNSGFNFDNDAYNRYDSLASEQDLSFLFETLSSVKDKNRNSAKVTANTIIANPDFDKIKDSNFNEYHYELFTDTLKKYPAHSRSFDLWKEGMSGNLFHPQYHGREHINVNYWMKEIQKNELTKKIIFENKILGLKDLINSNSRNSFMRAMDFNNEDELRLKENIIVEGLSLFKQIFNYSSQSFIAPSYHWDTNIEKVLSENGVKYLQGIQYQKVPKFGHNEFENKFHYIGQKNDLGQKYLVRNAFFEPTLMNENNTIYETLKRVNIAFKWGKPAIIGSHRINYIGFIDEKNRDKNLKELKTFLKMLVDKWPNVEFMSSDQLGNLIN